MKNVVLWEVSRVTLIRSDVSEESIASIIKVTRIDELWTLASTSNRNTANIPEDGIFQFFLCSPVKKTRSIGIIHNDARKRVCVVEELQEMLIAVKSGNVYCRGHSEPYTKLKHQHLFRLYVLCICSARMNE
jgi:hypothetical protein